MARLLPTLALAVVAMVLFAVTGDASAQIFDRAQGLADETLQGLRTIFYVGATIAVIVSALMALGGRWPWSRFFAIFGAVFVVAIVDQLITWLRG